MGVKLSACPSAGKGALSEDGKTGFSLKTRKQRQGADVPQAQGVPVLAFLAQQTIGVRSQERTEQPGPHPQTTCVARGCEQVGALVP